MEDTEHALQGKGSTSCTGAAWGAHSCRPHTAMQVKTPGTRPCKHGRGNTPSVLATASAHPWKSKRLSRSSRSMNRRRSAQYTSPFTLSAVQAWHIGSHGCTHAMALHGLAQHALHGTCGGQHGVHVTVAPPAMQRAALSIAAVNSCNQGMPMPRTCEHGGRAAQRVRHRIVARLQQEPAAAGGCSGLVPCCAPC